MCKCIQVFSRVSVTNCTKCNGKSGGCEYCKGYIPFNNISNPIFLITGHSPGVAVAKNTAGVTVAYDGETLTWRLLRDFPAVVYDVGVKDDSGHWYYTERVFELILRPNTD